MIAFTTMMWAAETLGYDTAPMEGFMEDQVKALLKFPSACAWLLCSPLEGSRARTNSMPEGFPPARTVFADTWGESIEF